MAVSVFDWLQQARSPNGGWAPLDHCVIAGYDSLQEGCKNGLLVEPERLGYRKLSKFFTLIEICIYSLNSTNYIRPYSSKNTFLSSYS